MNASTEINEAELDGQRADSLLIALARATDLLTIPEVKEPRVLDAAAILQTALAADRVCIQVTDHTHPSEMTIVHQRCRGNAIDVPALPIFESWRRQFSAGELVQRVTREAPDPERQYLAAQRVDSTVAAPIIVQGLLRGFIRFDNTRARASWSEEALAIIRTAGVIFSNALGHREAQARLEQSDAKFQRLVEHSPDVIYRMSLPDGHYEYISPAALEVCGYTPDDFYRNPSFIESVLHPGWLAYFREQWAKLIEGEMPPTYSYVIIHGQTGEPRWLHQRNALIRDDRGAPMAIEGIVSDVTARRVAETRLHTSDVTLQSVLRAAPIGIALNSDRTMLLVNDRLCEMTGYTRDELIGRETRLFYQTEEEFNRVGQELVARLEGDDCAALESQWVRKDGTRFDVWLTATTVTPNDYPAGVVFTAFDVSAFRAGEQTPKLRDNTPH